jgi:hypothetical protein
VPSAHNCVGISPFYVKYLIESAGAQLQFIERAFNKTVLSVPRRENLCLLVWFDKLNEKHLNGGGGNKKGIRFFIAFTFGL